MKARELLRAAADELVKIGCDATDCQCPSGKYAAALQELAERLDSLKRDVDDRQRALNNSVELGYLRINHGEGEAQHREIQLLRASLARLDADLSPPLQEDKT